MAPTNSQDMLFKFTLLDLIVECDRVAAIEGSVKSAREWAGRYEHEIRGMLHRMLPNADPAPIDLALKTGPAQTLTWFLDLAHDVPVDPKDYELFTRLLIDWRNARIELTHQTEAYNRATTALDNVHHKLAKIFYNARLELAAYDVAEATVLEIYDAWHNGETKSEESTYRTGIHADGHGTVG